MASDTPPNGFKHALGVTLVCVARLTILARGKDQPCCWPVYLGRTRAVRWRGDLTRSRDLLVLYQ